MNINLDISGSKDVIYVDEQDTSTSIVFYIKDNGSAVDLTGLTLSFVLHRTSYIVAPLTITSAGSGIATLTLTSAMTASPGTLAFEVVGMESDDTPEFDISSYMVVQKVYSGSDGQNDPDEENPGIDVLYGEEAPDDETDGENKDFYFTLIDNTPQIDEVDYVKYNNMSITSYTVNADGTHNITMQGQKSAVWMIKEVNSAYYSGHPYPAWTFNPSLSNTWSGWQYGDSWVTAEFQQAETLTKLELKISIANQETRTAYYAVEGSVSADSPVWTNILKNGTEIALDPSIGEDTVLSFELDDSQAYSILRIRKIGGNYVYCSPKNVIIYSRIGDKHYRSSDYAERVDIPLKNMVVGKSYTLGINIQYGEGTEFDIGAVSYVSIGSDRRTIYGGYDVQTNNFTFTYSEGDELTICIYQTVGEFTIIANSTSMGTDYYLGDLYNKYEDKWFRYKPKEMIGATATTDGESGTVPKPTIADKDKFFKGDGTWAEVGTPITPNPSGTATATMEKISVNGTVYDFASAISNLMDVDLTNLANGQILKYNSTTQKWESEAESGGASAVSDLTDVELTNLADKEILEWDAVAEKWKNVANSGGGSGNVDDVYVNGTSVLDANHIAQVKSYKELTQSEYDALPDDKLTDDILYCIKDTGIVEGEKFAPIIYSLEEREVGVWADGKPLYQKTINIGDISGASQNASLGLQNIDHIELVNDGSYFLSDNNPLYPMPIPYALPTAQNIVGGFFEITSNDALFCVRVGSGMAGYVKHMVVTVRYTKTTDTAGSGKWASSGVPSVHYSTNEQVIGTWIDGKPIYQKTYEITQVTVVPNGTIIQNFDITNISKIINAVGTSTQYQQSAPLLAFIDSGNFYISSSLACAIDTITLQYTKTTD